MTPLLVHLQPFDVAANARVDVRIASALEAEAYGLNSVPWSPALHDRPQMSIEIMSTDLSGRVQVGRARFSMSLENAGLARTRSLKWGGAPVKIYSAKVLAWPAVTEFDGEVVDHSYDIDTGLLTITAEVSTSLIEKPLLTLEFDGSTGAGGDAAKRGTLKPAGFGSCENIPPVWFDSARNIGMIDGYGNCTAITKLMEGASDMGASVGNYANYAALAAAIDSKAIAPGRWGTCIAEGLVGLGAPPVGVIGVNATFGSNRLGAMMSRILSTHAGVAAGQIDSASFTALDTALNYPAHYWTDQQIECKTLLEMMARSANATLLLSFQRKVAISRAVATASVATLDRSGSQLPRCVDWKILSPMKPTWRLKARAARPAQVLDFDQVNYVDTIIDRGAYSGTTVYRAGNLVWMSDKSSWLYTNATATSGNAPPTYPATSNAYWQNLAPPANAANITYASGATLESLKPAEPGANVTETRTAAAIANQSGWATYSTFPPNAVTQPGANLIYDAGLTLGSQQWSLAGWTWGYGSDVGYFVAAPGSSVNMQIGSRMSVYGGNPYTFSLYSGGTGYAGAGTMQLNYYDSGDNFLGQVVGAGTAQNIGYGRTQITASLPANAAYVRCFMQSPASLTGWFIVHRPKLEIGSTATIWSNEATYGARYQGGVTIDTLKPAEVGANVTESRTAAAIANQAAWATYSGDSPSTYQLRVQYMDTSGQLSGIDRIVNRRMTLLKRADGFTDLTESAAITALGTAAAIANQGQLATQNSLKISQLLAKSASYCPDPQFQDETFWAPDPGGWYYQIATPAQSGTGAKAAALWSGNPNDTTGTTRKHIWSAYCECPVPVGTKLMISAHHWNSSNQYSYAEVKFRDTNNNDVGSITCLCPPNSAGIYSNTGIVPQATRYIQFVIYNQSGTAYSGAMQITSIRLIDVSQYSDGVLIDALRPAEVGANVTANWTAAAIANQGALATMSSVGSSVMTASFGANLLPSTNPASVDPEAFFQLGWNPDGITGLMPYCSAQKGNFGYEWSVDPGQSTWGIYQPNGGRGTNTYGITDFYFKWLRDAQSAGDFTTEFSVNPGQRIEFSAYLGNHRSDTCRLGLAFYDSAGNGLGEGTGTQLVDIANGESLGGNELRGYKRCYIRTTAPANAIRCLPFIRKGHTASGFSDSWLFITHPMIAIVPVNQSELSPWTPPGNFGYALYSNGQTMNALKPAELGANVTANWTAAAIANQAAWATLGWSTNRISQLTDGGRAVDGRLLNSSNNYGLRALSEVPTFSQTNAGSSVTLDLGSNGKLYSDWGATITLPSATITGLAYSSTYYLWRNMPSPDGAGSSYGYSTALTDALGVGKVYLGYVTTMTSGGTGGGGGGYGGGNCVDADSLIVLTDGEDKQARDIVIGDYLTVLGQSLSTISAAECEANLVAENDCVRLTTESGIQLTLALNTPMTLPGERWEVAANMLHRPVAVLDHGTFRWETCIAVDYAGKRPVAKISCGNATYAAGDEHGRYIFSHNIYAKP